MNKGATCYTIYWNDVLVGFRCCLALPSGTIKHAWRGSRTVILPDYQNLGFGTAIVEFIAEYYLSKGLKFFDRSSHLRLKNHWENSPYWLATSSNGKVSNNGSAGTDPNRNFGKRDRELGRVAYSFEYMGKEYVEKPHIYIHIDDNENINYKILEEDLTYLKQKYWLCVVTGEINTPSEIENICLRLGIRTQLLYTTKRKEAKLNNAYKNKKILTTWDEEFSRKIRKRY